LGKGKQYKWVDPGDRNFLIAAAYDTLGMSELVTGVVAKEEA
jgi:hypothetical protein